jgi:hypothetical protein
MVKNAVAAVIGEFSLSTLCAFVANGLAMDLVTLAIKS